MSTPSRKTDPLSNEFLRDLSGAPSFGNEQTDAIGKKGSTKSNPLDLKNIQTLEKESTMWIRSKYAVHLIQIDDEGKVSSVSTIQCPSSTAVRTYKHKMYLVPDARLEPVFATMWNKLPNEIRISILAQNLKVEGVIKDVRHYSFLLEQHAELYPKGDRSIVYETFYKINEFEVVINLDLLTPITGIDKKYRRWIRKIKLVMDATSEDFEVLQDLTSEKLGFTGLEYIHLKIWEWHSSVYSRVFSELARRKDDEIPSILNAFVPGEVTFGCRGKFEWPAEYWDGVPDTDILNKRREILLDAMKEKIIFAGGRDEDVADVEDEDDSLTSSSG